MNISRVVRDVEYWLMAVCNVYAENKPGRITALRNLSVREPGDSSNSSRYVGVSSGSGGYNAVNQTVSGFDWSNERVILSTTD